MKIAISHDYRDADAAHRFTKYAVGGLGFAVLYQDTCETMIAHPDFTGLDYTEQKAVWNYIVDNELNVRISWVYIPQAGDVVAMVRGQEFSNGSTQATVDRVEVFEGQLAVWLVETKTWIATDSIMLVHRKIQVGE